MRYTVLLTSGFLLLIGCIFSESYIPTFEDYTQILVETNVTILDFPVETKRYRHYASIYILTECIDDDKPTAKGFRSFVQDRFGPEYFSAQRRAYELKGLASHLIRDLRAIADPDIDTPTQEMSRLRQRGITEPSSIATRPCLQSFLYPKTREQATLFVGLLSSRWFRETPTSTTEFYDKELVAVLNTWLKMSESEKHDNPFILIWEARTPNMR